MKSCRLGFAAAAVALGISGCGKSSPGLTVPASGVVLYHGAPATDVRVTFTPASGRPAIGHTDDEGRFTLMTFKPDDGAVPGVHKACITDRRRTFLPDPKTKKIAPGRFPERYQSIAASPWEFEVKPDGENDFRLEMVD